MSAPASAAPLRVHVSAYEEVSTGMRVEGTYTFPGDRARVFATLTDPDALFRAMPGCERFIQLGPGDPDGGVGYELRLRLGQARQPYTITVRVKASRRPAYLKLDVRGVGPNGPITGDGALDLVEQASHTVVAYRFSVTGPELPDIDNSATRATSFMARAACAHLADEIYADLEQAPARTDGAASGEFTTPRGRIVTRSVEQNGAHLSALNVSRIGWVERAAWMGAGLSVGLTALALAAAIVRRLDGDASAR